MSARDRFVVWPERSGNPLRDNRARLMNTRISRVVVDRVGVEVPAGRRRKKELMKRVRIDFITLLAAAMQRGSLAERGIPLPIVPVETEK